MPCTALEDTTCQIVNHLSAWNELLFPDGLQLREVPGTRCRLSLASFQAPTSLYQGSIIQRVCHLLKTHCCIARVEFYLDLFEFDELHLKRLSDALQGSPSITSVYLRWEKTSDEAIVAAAFSLPGLQELECVFNIEPSAQLSARLSTRLQTTSLTTLKLSELIPTGMIFEDFCTGLAQNRSLAELEFPSSFIVDAPASAQTAFTKWLENSDSLKRLTVRKSFLPYSVMCILQGLLGNRSITAVDFERPEVDQADVQLLSKIFKQNRYLRSFKIYWPTQSSTSLVEERPNKAYCDRCLKALVENDNLEEVALPIDIGDEDHWKELFLALPTKKNLKRVNIEALGNVPPLFVDKLCTALKETGAGEKVSFNAFLSEKEFDKWFECKAFLSVRLHANNANKTAVCGILERMPSLGDITWLGLNFDGEDGEDDLGTELSLSLATFLGATQTLRTLSLSTSWDTLLYMCQKNLMDGLAANTSLREVEIYVEEVRGNFFEFNEALGQTLNASKNISRLKLTVSDHYYGVEASYQQRYFLGRLAEGIANNCTLLDLTATLPLFAPFKVMDATRHNQGLMTCAADFARGARRDRRCALALDRMQDHPELVEQVAQLEKVAQARAATMVQQGLRRIEGLHEFMRLAGVVRERVSCHASRDGRLQLDALNDHCWRAIRRYLRVHDIKDATAEPLPPQ